MIADLRDRSRLSATIGETKPQVVFHLAAQSLVRRAHAEPVETFETNIMGTVYLLEALRDAPGLLGLIVVTSDKVYDNQEQAHAFSEVDALGGREPYGVSKACAELAVRTYWHSFFEGRGPAIATARAGNVIGGGTGPPTGSCRMLCGPGPRARR